MLKPVQLPIALLLAFPISINYSFVKKEHKIPVIYTDGPVKTDSAATAKTATIAVPETEEKDAYTEMDLRKKGLTREAFDLAVKGYNNMSKKRLLRNKNIITVIDFSKPSDQKRLYVIDLKKNKLVLQSLVAHGRNSGLEYATSFSNETDSHKSSLGFYVTMGTYNGDHGYALKLKGCEKGFNNNAYNRAIVVHGSEYVTDEFLKSNGFLGRSFGCPALPEKSTKKIIDVIKNGSCFFIYYPAKKYLLASPVLNG
jgi:hypothetical protein